MKKAVRRIIGMSVSATLLTAGVVALRHMLETPQPLKSPLPGEALLYVWQKRSIFYKALGDPEAPPLVLLHTPDIGASAREMQHIMEPLAQTYRVYAPDLLGFGLSDRPGIAYSAATYAELCHDFVRDVVKGPATLVASGLSCNYAVTVASSAPELCAGLVLLSPGALHGEQEPPHLLREFAEKPLSKALLYPLLSTRLAFQLTHTNSQADFAQFYATTHQLGAEHAAMALLSGKLSKDTAREFEGLTQPVLLIWGTQAMEDQRNRASLHDSKQRHRSRAVELIQGAGLAVHEEQPEHVVAAIRRWQAEVGAQLLSGAEPHAQSLAATIQQTAQAGAVNAAPAAYAYAERPQFTSDETAPDEVLQATHTRQEEPEDTLSAGKSNSASQTQSILAYCVKCKQKTEMLNASEFTMKNGRVAVRGTCAVCGTGTNRIGGMP